MRISDWSSDVCSSDLFRPGEAYQFDWSHEDVEIAGKPMRVKVAHVRLCASRAMYVRAYPRETQEMLFDAHARAFAFFGGVPTRGIRSEEHTSELQSLMRISYAVFCLKKKKHSLQISAQTHDTITHD